MLSVLHPHQHTVRERHDRVKQLMDVANCHRDSFRITLIPLRGETAAKTRGRIAMDTMCQAVALLSGQKSKHSHRPQAQKADGVGLPPQRMYSSLPRCSVIVVILL